MANNNYADLPVEGKTVPVTPDELAIPRARSFAALLQRSATTSLLRCERLTADNLPTFKNGDEILVFDLRVETGQQPALDIRYTERIAVQFTEADDYPPWVYVLRKDFPQAPHMNSMNFRVPKSICIYEQTWDEIKLKWRPASFLAGIHRWFRGTAEGNLHQDNQPLEPFIIGAQGYIYLPKNRKRGQRWKIRAISGIEGQRYNLLLVPEVSATSDDQKYTVVEIALPPQEHGVIGYTPRNFSDLAAFFSGAGLSLQEVLQQKLVEEAQVLAAGNEALLSTNLLILCSIPKTTAEGVEETDDYVFLSPDTIRQIGLKMGLFIEAEGVVGRPLVTPAFDPAAAGSSMLDVLVPQFPLTASQARKLTGLESRLANPAVSIVLIGTGALGSAIYAQSVKKGLGSWSLMDEDFLLPHNLVRHELDQHDILAPKALALATRMAPLTVGNVPKAALWDNYLHPRNPHAVNEELAGAELILDVSTSIPVARDLAVRKDTSAKRVSLFLNPSGTDLVVLAEDRQRTVTLDCLEHQYYRHLLYDSRLADHYRFPSAGVRYAGGCRDVASRISPDILSIAGGIASRKLEHIIANEEPVVSIWQVDEATLGVTPIELTVAATSIQDNSGWGIVTDSFVMEKIRAHRKNRLPNETGGILIGAYDLSRHRIYIVDTILSPEDSEEYPTAYIRGIKGLKEELANIAKKTAGNLIYVGEWHSHPDEYSTAMSDDDKACFTWLETEMLPLGFPALMLIAGEKCFEVNVSAVDKVANIQA